MKHQIGFQTANDNSVLLGAYKHLGLLHLSLETEITLSGSCSKTVMLSLLLKLHNLNDC